MKIAVWHNLPSGGGKRALHDHVKGLVARGHTVEAWCPPTADTRYLPLSEIITEHVVLLGSTNESRLQTLRRRATGRLIVDEQIAAMQEHSRRSAEQIAAGGFDVLFANSCQMFGAPFIGRQGALPPGLPKVLYLQEPNRTLYEANPALPWVAAPLLQKASLPRRAQALYRDLRRTQNLRVQAYEEWRNAHSFDVLLVNSRFSRESIKRSYGRDSLVCYLGVSTEIFHEAPEGAAQARREKDYVIGVGAFDPRKGVDFVVDAIALIPEPRPRLIWVGNFYSSHYLEMLTQQSQAKGVSFEAKIRISDQELVALYRGAVAMAYAPTLEPFGFTPLEANFCGVPVVAVAEGGVRETIVEGKNGFLVEHHPAEMAKGIEKIRNNPSLAAALGETASSWVREHWSMDAAIDRLEQRLEQACKSRAEV